MKKFFLLSLALLSFVLKAQNTILPYNEGFESFDSKTTDVTSLANRGWISSANNQYAYCYITINHSHSGTNALAIYNHNNQSAVQTVSVPINFNLSGKHLSLWYKNDGITDNMSQLEVGYYTNNNLTSFVSVYTASRVQSYASLSVTFPDNIPQDAKPALRATGAYSLYIDDIHINEIVYANIFSDTTCMDSAYTGHGMTIPASMLHQGNNVFSDTTLAYSEGSLDTIYPMNVYVLPQTNTDIFETICPGQSYNFHGTNYTQSGIYPVITSYSQYGCPISETLHLRVLGDTTMYVSVCPGGSYLFIDTVITTAGTYTKQIYVPSCFSYARITAYIMFNNYLKPVNVYDDVCEGFPYYGYGIYGIIVTGDTTITKTAKTQNGCDSITYINLRFIPTKYTDVYKTINKGQSYTWSGQTYTKAGDYTLTFMSYLGCDSVVTLHLTVKADVEGITDNDIMISPNPVRPGEAVTIQCNMDNISYVEIINNIGTIVSSIPVNDFPIQFNGINSPGLYYIRIIKQNGSVHLKKLIVL